MPADAGDGASACRAVQGSDFDLAPRYGEVLNLMALAFTFAASLPLMLPIAAVVLLLAYWAQLAELLRASRRPPAQARSSPFPPLSPPTPPRRLTCFPNPVVCTPLCVQPRNVHWHLQHRLGWPRCSCGWGGRVRACGRLRENHSAHGPRGGRSRTSWTRSSDELEAERRGY